MFNKGFLNKGSQASKGSSRAAKSSFPVITGAGSGILARLPAELLRSFIVYPTAFPHVNVDDNESEHQRWLAIKHDWTPSPLKGSPQHWKEHNPQAALQVLRALSQTCRSLRAFALPLLWEVVHIDTVRELGIVRDVLGSNPSIAPLIRSFSFFWCMNGDVWKCENYDMKHGNALDMAFIDRGALWDRTAMSVPGGYGVQVERGQTRNDGTFPFFEDHDHVRFDEPGNDPARRETGAGADEEIISDEEEEEQDMFGFDRPSKVIHYDLRGRNINRRGPDGKGADRRIKNPEDFDDCLVEVVGQLASLQTFRWICSATPVPVGVFEALKKVQLSSLYITMPTMRGVIGTLPFWELASNLKDLAIDRSRCVYAESSYEAEECEEVVENTRNVTEAELESFHIPSTIKPSSLSKVAKDALQNSIICRTIIEAARGGQLRRLWFEYSTVQEVFSIPSLLPHWVNVVKWHSWNPPQLGENWLAAAEMLRPLLCHASLWLPESVKGARDDRKLTREDVRSLHSHFASVGLPHVEQREWLRQVRDFQHMSLYLPWLAENAELAQKVADAWNAAVSGGEADLVKCPCTHCKQGEALYV